MLSTKQRNTTIFVSLGSVDLTTLFQQDRILKIERLQSKGKRVVLQLFLTVSPVQMRGSPAEWVIDYLLRTSESSVVSGGSFLSKNDIVL